MDEPICEAWGREMMVVRMNAREIIVLANALNEAREAVEDWEFVTRLGVTPAEADTLGSQLRALLRQE